MERESQNKERTHTHTLYCVAVFVKAFQSFADFKKHISVLSLQLQIKPARQLHNELRTLMGNSLKF